MFQHKLLKKNYLKSIGGAVALKTTLTTLWSDKKKPQIVVVIACKTALRARV